METRRMAAERERENGIPVAAMVDPLSVMVQTVARRKRMIGATAEAWVEAILYKFDDIGVESVQDFVRGILLINHDLARSGSRQLPATTLDMMLEEAVGMVQWPVCKGEVRKLATEVSKQRENIVTCID